jgi:hypothetical protein
LANTLNMLANLCAAEEDLAGARRLHGRTLAL